MYVFGGAGPDGEWTAGVESFGYCSGEAADAEAEAEARDNMLLPVSPGLAWRLEPWLPVALRSHSVAQCADVLYVVGGFGFLSDATAADGALESPEAADGQAANATDNETPTACSLPTVYACPVDR
jgi:hypothetical protein